MGTITILKKTCVLVYVCTYAHVSSHVLPYVTPSWPHTGSHCAVHPPSLHFVPKLTGT